MNLNTESKHFLDNHFKSKKDKHGIVFTNRYDALSWLKFFPDGSAVYVPEGDLRKVKKFNSHQEAVDYVKK